MATLTLEEAKRHVREAVGEHPGRKNPLFAGVCQYESPLPEHAGLRCIVGEVLVRAGLPLPTDNANFPTEGYTWPDVLSVYAEAMDLDTALWLGRLQRIFDGPGSHIPRAWSVCYSEAEREGMFD